MRIKKVSISVSIIVTTFTFGLLTSKFLNSETPSTITQNAEIKQICVEKSDDKSFEDKMVKTPCKIDWKINSVQYQEPKKLEELER